MRLLNTRTGKFEEFQNNSEIPRYAILSHTWSKEGEQTYEDVRRVQKVYKAGAVKQGTSPLVSNTARLLAAQQGIMVEPIATDPIAPTSAVEAPPDGGHESLGGVLSLLLA